MEVSLIHEFSDLEKLFLRRKSKFESMFQFSRRLENSDNGYYMQCTANNPKILQMLI